MNKKPLLIANWKMKLLPHEQIRLARQVARMIVSAGESFLFAVAPTIESTALIAKILKGASISLCAQNCFWEERGAYTGEVSPRALKELGCSYVLVGHSERRIHFGETDEMVAKKMKAISEIPGLQSILCIGEPLEVRRKGIHLSFLEKQLVAALRLIPKNNVRRVVIAYEPLWAISTAKQMVGTVGKPIMPDDCSRVTVFLKKIMARMHPTAQTTILYGGSVDADNVRSFVGAGVSDGALIGGASVDYEHLKKIFHSLKRKHVV